MAGRKSLPRHLRLATGPQLWALNRAAKLKLVEDEELSPVSNADADGAIRRSMAKDARRSMMDPDPSLESVAHEEPAAG